MNVFCLGIKLILVVYYTLVILVCFLHTIYICFHICSSYFGHISLVWPGIKLKPMIY